MIFSSRESKAQDDYCDTPRQLFVVCDCPFKPLNEFASETPGRIFFKILLEPSVKGKLKIYTNGKKFKELLPVLSSRHLSFKTCGRVYSSCVGRAMLHASETWPLTKPNLQRLQWNDRAMIRQICNVRPQDVVTTRPNELLAWLGIEELDLTLKERRNRWYGHVESSNGAVKTAFDIQVDGKGGPRRTKMTWKQLIERDCKEHSRLSTLMIEIYGDLV